MGIVKDLIDLEHHDKLVVIAVVLLFVGAIFMIADMNAAETTGFIRGSIIDLAILLLLADMIIHLGKIEGKILAEERKIERKLFLRKKSK